MGGARGPCAFVGMTLRCAALPCTPHPHRGQERQRDVVPRQTEGLPATGEHLLPARQACLYNINMHGLESNPGSSLQTEEEAGLP